MKNVIKLIGVIAVWALFQGVAHAIVIDTWTSNDADTGNYSLEITQGSGLLNFALTIDPWNAEALGVFIDLGDVDITDTTLSNISSSPNTGSILLYANDTTSNTCAANNRTHSFGTTHCPSEFLTFPVHIYFQGLWRFQNQNGFRRKHYYLLILQHRYS